jgi:hypothetical protein
MDPYPSNSYKSKEETPPTDEATPKLRVVPEGTRVIRRRAPMGRRFKENFIGEGQTYMGGLVRLISEVIVPTINEFQGIISAIETVSRMVRGDLTAPQTRNTNRPNVVNNLRPMTNYSRYSKDPSPRAGRGYERYEYDEIILPSINDVRDVISRLRNDLEEYEFVSLRDLYEMIGSGFSHTDERWGWYDLNGAYPKHVSNGYLLVLPPVQPRG